MAAASAAQAHSIHSVRRQQLNQGYHACIAGAEVSDAAEALQPKLAVLLQGVLALVWLAWWRAVGWAGRAAAAATLMCQPRSAGGACFCHVCRCRQPLTAP